MAQLVTWVPWDGHVRSVVKRGAHSMTKRICNWPYCARCGLVALKNEATRQALRRQCEWFEDVK